MRSSTNNSNHDVRSSVTNTVGTTSESSTNDRSENSGTNQALQHFIDNVYEISKQLVIVQKDGVNNASDVLTRDNAEDTPSGSNSVECSQLGSVERPTGASSEQDSPNAGTEQARNGSENGPGECRYLSVNRDNIILSVIDESVEQPDGLPPQQSNSNLTPVRREIARPQNSDTDANILDGNSQPISNLNSTIEILPRAPEGNAVPPNENPSQRGTFAAAPIVHQPLHYGRSSFTSARYPLAATRPERCFHSQSHFASDTVVTAPTSPTLSHGPPPIVGAPPTYSTVMRLGPAVDHDIRHPIRVQPSPPFLAPIPPPPYSEMHGYHVERPVLVASGEHMVWGPDPISVVCPRCGHVVVTATRAQRSNLTHFSALALFLCGCWPCCFLPYCMDSCKNTYHNCPSCQQFLGVYRPW